MNAVTEELTYVGQFIIRTYAHLLGALLTFGVLLFVTGSAPRCGASVLSAQESQ